MQRKKFPILFTLLLTVLLLGTLSGCGSNDDEEETFPYTIGIDYYGDNSALSVCRKGMIETLAEAGIVEDENLKIINKNGNCDQETAKQNTASILAQDPTLICAFSTPMAQIAAAATADTDLPVVYTGVTDTRASGLDANNVTGVSAPISPEKQLALIREMLPEATRLGIVYCPAEENSLLTLEAFKAVAADYGFTIVESPIDEVNDIYLAADKLLLEVDCVTTINDNTVANTLSVLLKKATTLKIPVFGNQLQQVKSGCVAAVGIDYYQLGVETGKIVAKILQGDATVKEISPITVDDTEIYYNPDKLDELGLTLPETLGETALDVNEVDEASIDEETTTTE